ncbi:hypothetical protein AAH994_12475 [Weeksellaceae bacterium A-14]
MKHFLDLADLLNSAAFPRPGLNGMSELFCCFYKKNSKKRVVKAGNVRPKEYLRYLKKRYIDTEGERVFATDQG